jgi:acyl-CoA thioester hydrolase
MTEPGIWLPLRFRDLDAFGHVYHAEYLTLLDDARTRWFGDVVGLDDPVSYVVARVEIDYVSSLVLEDGEAGFSFEVERVGASSLTLRETIRARDGRVVARARTVTVRRDPDAGVSRALSDAERSSLLRFTADADDQ